MDKHFRSDKLTFRNLGLRKRRFRPYFFSAAPGRPARPFFAALFRRFRGTGSLFGTLSPRARRFLLSWPRVRLALGVQVLAPRSVLRGRS